MNIWKKALSVGLSLTLCASLVVPSFAASFADLQNAIDGAQKIGNPKDEVYESAEDLKSADDLKASTDEKDHKDGTAFRSGDQVRFGYAWNTKENWFGIEAWNTSTDEKTGKPVARQVQLNEDVEMGEDETKYIILQNTKCTDVTIDLNGNDIDANGATYAFAARTGTELTIQDNSEEQDGKITGATEFAISCKKGAILNLESGAISGNNSGLVNEGTFNMTGGTISENQVNGVYNGSTFNMDGGEISENKGSGVYNAGTLNMTGGEMKDNQGKADIVCAFNETNVSGEAEIGSVRLEAKRDEGDLNGVRAPILTIDRELDVKDEEIWSSYWVSGVDNAEDPTDPTDPTDPDNPDDHSGNAGNDKPNEYRYQITTTPLFTTVSEVEKDGETSYQYTIQRVRGEVEDSAMSVSSGDALDLPEVSLKDYSTQEAVTPVGVECVKLESSDPSVAYVDDNGNWVCLKSGTVTLTATYTDKATACNTFRSAFEVKFTVTVNVPSNDDPAFEFGSGTEIDDVDIPLAGLFTRADAIGYLWEQSGSPEWELSTFADVPEDHEWAVAIGWAQANGIAVADEDGNFRPDELVLRSTEDAEGELQEFLNRYAVYAGIELDADELFIELGGVADDIVMGEEAQAIFDDFFAKLEAALAQAA